MLPLSVPTRRCYKPEPTGRANSSRSRSVVRLPSRKHSTASRTPRSIPVPIASRQATSPSSEAVAEARTRPEEKLHLRQSKSIVTLPGSPSSKKRKTFALLLALMPITRQMTRLLGTAALDRPLLCQPLQLNPSANILAARGLSSSSMSPSPRPRLLMH